MPEVKELPYLSGNDIPGGQTRTLTILTPHEETYEMNGEEKTAFNLLVELDDGGKRNWSVNKTSQRILVALHGANSDTWVGKKAKVYTLSQKVSGQDKKVIYAKAERLN